MESSPCTSVQPVQQTPFPFPIQDIIIMKGSGGYTQFIPSKGRPVLTCHTLHYYESMLPEYFVRVHKGYIINLAYVKEVYPQDKTIYMTDGSSIVVPRLKWPQVKDVLVQHMIYKSVA